MAWIVGIEVGVLSLLMLVFGLGFAGPQGVAPGEIAEALWRLLRPLVPCLAVRTVVAYLVAHSFSTGRGDSFATTMACSAAVLAAGCAAHQSSRWQKQLTYAAGGAVLAYLSTYFVALRHRPSAALAAETVPAALESPPTPAPVPAVAPAIREAPSAPATPSSTSVGVPRIGGSARPVHHPAVAAVFVLAFLGSLALLTLPAPWKWVLDDPLALFQAAGTACLMAWACAEAARRGRPMVAIPLLAASGLLLLLQLARHSFLMMQRNVLETLPFGIAGKFAASFIEIPAECLHDSSWVCGLVLGALVHSAPITLGLSLVLGVVLLWTLILRVWRSRRGRA